MKSAAKAAFIFMLLSCLTGCEHLLNDYSVGEGEDCYDGEDNDGDGYIDCWDPDCGFQYVERACADGIDNDCDGNMDCWDSDCADSGECGCLVTCMARGYETGTQACGSSQCFCRIAYEDTFDDPESGFNEAEVEGVVWEYEDGGVYNIYVGKESWYAWSFLPTDTQYSDFTIEFDIKLRSSGDGHGGGVMFRVLDSTNHYKAIIGNGTYRMIKRENDEWETFVPWTLSDNINGSGIYNHVKISVIGSQISLCVNDALIDTIFDESTSLTSGFIALVGDTMTDAGADAVFDNLKLYDQ